MDNIDTVIMESLRKDSRTPFMQIAKKLGVSEGTIRQRIKHLVSSKKISRFTIETENNAAAIVGVQTQTRTQTKHIVDKIKAVGAQSVYEVTGRFDIICLIPGPDMRTMNNMLEKIRVIPGVMHTETFTVLEKH